MLIVVDVCWGLSSISPQLLTPRHFELCFGDCTILHSLPYRLGGMNPAPAPGVGPDWPKPVREGSSDWFRNGHVTWFWQWQGMNPRELGTGLFLIRWL